jgi:ribose 5-phosphate isomerase A
MEELKQKAAERAVDWIENGMTLGLGSGSTAAYAVRALGERLSNGRLRRVIGVPTSRATEFLAQECGIPLSTLSAHPQLDLTIDGADEMDDHLNLIKGLGGALLREKIVASASTEFVVVTDYTKHVLRLGTRAPLPIEVIPFGWQTHLGFLGELGAEVTLRRRTDGNPYVSDNGNFILDARFRDGIQDAFALARLLERRPGLVEHGLFLQIANRACVGTQDGIMVLKRRHL